MDTEESPRLPIPEGCLISEYANGHLVINSYRRRWRWTDHTAECGCNLPRVRQHPARADSDEQNARRAYAPAVGSASGSGAEYEAEKAQTEDGASGGPAEERTCAWGRGMRLLKMEEEVNRM